MKTLNRSQVTSFIESTNGKFFTLAFVKKDGSTRVMTARTGVTKHLKGGTATYSANPNNIGVFDTVKGGYRCFDKNSVKVITFKDETYVIEG